MEQCTFHRKHAFERSSRLFVQLGLGVVVQGLEGLREWYMVSQDAAQADVSYAPA